MTQLTDVQLTILRERFPGIGEAVLRRNADVLLAGPHLAIYKTPDAPTPCRSLPHPEPEPNQAATLDGTSPRKKESIRRTVVRFVGYRVRPLDPDNFAGSVKDLLDGLRHAGVISGDEPWRIRLETEQIKVGSYAEERTEIIIDPLTEFVG